MICDEASHFPTVDAGLASKRFSVSTWLGRLLIPVLLLFCSSSALAESKGILVVGKLPLNESEVMIQKRMMERFQVEMIPILAAELTDADAENKALVFVACTSSSGDLEDKLKGLPVPIINTEGWNYDDFLMTGNVYGEDYGCYNLGKFGFIPHKQSHVVIQDKEKLPELSEQRIAVHAEPSPMIYGRALPSATVWAAADHETAKAVVFTYDKGDADASGGSFPGKRAGFFVYNDTAKNLTPEGWYLFDQVVAWALE